jgi:hypothetical protein
MKTTEGFFIGDVNHPGYYFWVEVDKVKLAMEEMMEDGLAPYVADSIDECLQHGLIPIVSEWGLS